MPGSDASMCLAVDVSIVIALPVAPGGDHGFIVGAAFAWTV